MAGLLTEAEVNSARNINVDRKLRRFYKPAFNLSPVGLEGEKIPTQLGARFSLRSIKTFGAQAVHTVMPSLAVSGTQELANGMTGTAALVVTVRRNLEQNVLRYTCAAFDVRPPCYNQTFNTFEIQAFDSRDYEMNNFALSVVLARTLAPGLRGSLTLNAGISQYINSDSTFSLQGIDQKRWNFSGSANGALHYSFYKDISFFGGATYQSERSSLGVGQVQSASDAVKNFQSSSLGNYSRYVLNLGLSMNF